MVLWLIFFKEAYLLGWLKYFRVRSAVWDQLQRDPDGKRKEKGVWMKYDLS